MDRVSQAAALTSALVQQMCSSIGVLHELSHREPTQVPGTTAVFAGAIADTTRALQSVIATLPARDSSGTRESDAATYQAQACSDSAGDGVR